MRFLCLLLLLTPLAAQDVEALLKEAKTLVDKQDYDGAIAIYGKAIASAPKNARAYLERGHRYLNTRRFTEGLADLKKADKLAPHTSEVAYHLALAHYLMGDFKAAAKVYKACLGATTPATGPETMRTCGPDSTKDPGGRMGMTDWAYRANRRAGNQAEAARLLAQVPDGLKLEAGNEAYYRTLRYYKGSLTADQALDGLKGVYFAGTGYGVANYQLLEGKKADGCAILRKVLDVKEGHFGWGAVAGEIEFKKSCEK